MDFAEMLELLRNPPESGVPENIFDELASNVLGREQRDRDALEGAQARIAELESSQATLAADLQRVKATNFDLLMSSGAKGGDDSANDESGDNDKPLTTDDLFE